MSEVLSMSEYQELGRRYLVNFVKRAGHSVSLIESQDALDNIVKFMIDADVKFDGRGNREGFRWQYAKFGYRDYISKEKYPIAKKQKITKGMVSLSSFKKKDLEKSVDIAVDNRAPHDAVESYELREKIMQTTGLTEQEKIAVIARFYDAESLESIGDRLNVSREYARILLKNATRKLKKILKEYA